jgi:hypothetical protein
MSEHLLLRQCRPMKNLKCFLVITFVFFLCWQLHENSKIEVHIPAWEGKDSLLLITRKDRRSLEQLFYAMLREDGAYTLLGSKPMHMFGFYTPFSTFDWEIFFSSISPRNLRIYQGWKTWLRYQYLLEKSEFKLWAEKNPFWEKMSTPHNPAVSVFLMNKKRTDEIIGAHLSDFETILNRENLTCDQLLFEAKNRSFFNDVLKGHEGLIGTLFGYGRENAWLFEEREHGKPVPLGQLWEQEIDDFYMNRPRFAWKYFGICTNKLSEVLGYPNFVADPDSSETKRIKQKILETRQNIIDYYKGKDFLEATLSILINGVPLNEYH